MILHNSVTLYCYFRNESVLTSIAALHKVDQIEGFLLYIFIYFDFSKLYSDLKCHLELILTRATGHVSNFSAVLFVLLVMV